MSMPLAPSRNTSRNTRSKASASAVSNRSSPPRKRHISQVRPRLSRWERIASSRVLASGAQSSTMAILIGLFLRYMPAGRGSPERRISVMRRVMEPPFHFGGIVEKRRMFSCQIGAFRASPNAEPSVLRDPKRRSSPSIPRLFAKPPPMFNRSAIAILSGRENGGAPRGASYCRSFSPGLWRSFRVAASLSSPAARGWRWMRFVPGRFVSCQKTVFAFAPR